MTTGIEAWLAGLDEEQRQIATDLRALILPHCPPLSESVKWNQPCYWGRAMVCHLQKARGHVSLGFGQGAVLDDPQGLLTGTGKQMRHVKIPLGARPDRDALAGLIRQAVALDRG